MPFNGGWQFGLLCSLVGNSWGSIGGLTADGSGNFYGTTYNNGRYDAGSVFKMTYANGGWTCSTVYDFTGRDDGGGPIGPVNVDQAGNIYGAANGGGVLGNGLIWEITP